MSSFYRVSTANMYDNSLRNLSARQKSMVDLQENLTTGKRVVRPSDDPVAAAQAERAQTRLARVQTEQRALETQRNAIAQAESTLGDAIGLVQEMRQLIVAAGSGTLKPEDRKTYAQQIESLREQLTATANRKDTNGMPLLGALGSALTPFLGPLLSTPDYGFAGLPGQAGSTGTGIAGALDGHSAFMFDPQRDGVYNASVTNAVTGAISTDRTLTTSAITPTNPSQVTGDNYQIVFGNVVANPATGLSTAEYTITNTTTGVSVGPTAVPPYPSDKPLTLEISDSTSPTNFVPGLRFQITGTPANGDTVGLQPSASLFSAIDSAIRDIGGAVNNNAATQAVGQALGNIDIGMERLHNLRGYAGELLNRADRITGDQANRSIQLESDRSRAEDLDMIQGISDFQNQQTGYEAALKSYAQVQKLSLFNFIS